MVKLTPMEHEIMKVLADGYVHSVDEIHQRTSNGEGSREAIASHVYNLRKVLNPLGDGIASHTLGGVLHYQYVRLTPSSYRG